MNKHMPRVIHISFTVNDIPRNHQTRIVNAVCNELVNMYHVQPHPNVNVSDLGQYTHVDVSYVLTNEVCQDVEWRLNNGYTN